MAVNTCQNTKLNPLFLNGIDNPLGHGLVVVVIFTVERTLLFNGGKANTRDFDEGQVKQWSQRKCCLLRYYRNSLEILFIFSLYTILWWSLG